MNADHGDPRKSVCDGIAVTLRLSGREIPEFKDTDRPILDYSGFDSQCGIEVTVELEQSLGINDLGDNIFVEGTGKSLRARCLRDIVNAVLAKLKTTRGA